MASRPLLTLALAAVVLLSLFWRSAMASYTWENRVLIIFSEESDPRLKAQTDALLAEPEALDERDMVVFAVIGDENVKPIHGKAPSGANAEALRQFYKVASGPGFSVLLIGKDGGVKWRADRPMEPAELFSLIDSMPMRQRETSR